MQLTLQSYCHLHRPGIGVGGACTGVSSIHPRYRLVKNIESPITKKCGRLVNEGMPSYAVNEALTAYQMFHAKAKNPEDYRSLFLDSHLEEAFQILGSPLREVIEEAL